MAPRAKYGGVDDRSRCALRAVVMQLLVAVLGRSLVDRGDCDATVELLVGVFESKGRRSVLGNTCSRVVVTTAAADDEERVARPRAECNEMEAELLDVEPGGVELGL